MSVNQPSPRDENPALRTNRTCIYKFIFEYLSIGVNFLLLIIAWVQFGVGFTCWNIYRAIVLVYAIIQTVLMISVYLMECYHTVLFCSYLNNDEDPTEKKDIENSALSIVIISSLSVIATLTYAIASLFTVIPNISSGYWHCPTNITTSLIKFI